MSPSPNDVEVEWQLDALDLRPAERWFGTLSTPRVGSESTLSDTDDALSAVTASAKPAERLVDTYFDTVDWQIGRSGHVLRVRNRAGRAEVTLKSLAKSAAGLRRRLEVTEPLPAVIWPAPDRLEKPVTLKTPLENVVPRGVPFKDAIDDGRKPVPVIVVVKIPSGNWPFEPTPVITGTGGFNVTVAVAFPFGPAAVTVSVPVVEIDAGAVYRPPAVTVP